MNAKLLTLLFSASLLLLAKVLVVPAYAEYKKTTAALKKSEESAVTMKSVSATAANFKDSPVNLQDHSLTLSTSVNSWLTSQAQYGVRVTQLSAPLPPSGQSKVQTISFVESDPLTKLSVQKLKLKGQYTSVLEFERYLANEFSASKAIVIDSLSMQGESFEIGASIFSTVD